MVQYDVRLGKHASYRGTYQTVFADQLHLRHGNIFPLQERVSSVALNKFMYNVLIEHSKESEVFICSSNSTDRDLDQITSVGPDPDWLELFSQPKENVLITNWVVIILCLTGGWW